MNLKMSAVIRFAVNLKNSVSITLADVARPKMNRNVQLNPFGHFLGMNMSHSHTGIKPYAIVTRSNLIP